jgi:hypothetical protein
MQELIITIPDYSNFYHLYADGIPDRKIYIKETAQTDLYYKRGSVVVLYYTYPAHREACVIRNACNGEKNLPGLSKPVDILFSVSASRVDKLRRAVGFLNEHYKDAYSFADDFYARLHCLLSMKGKLNYYGLNEIAKANALRVER